MRFLQIFLLSLFSSFAGLAHAADNSGPGQRGDSGMMGGPMMIASALDALLPSARMNRGPFQRHDKPNSVPGFGLVKNKTEAYIIDVRKLIANLLVMIVVIGSTLSSPAVMASAMQAVVYTTPAAAEACALCQPDASDQHQTASGTTSCAAAACAMFASMNGAGFQAIQPIRAMLLSSVSAHRGRLLEGPDPFPPRHSNA